MSDETVYDICEHCQQRIYYIPGSDNWGHDNNKNLRCDLWATPSKQQRVDVSLLRWCDWPGCLQSFDATTGPTTHGWMRHKIALLCAIHHAQNHHPTWTWNNADEFIVSKCSCGFEKEVRPSTLEAARIAWEEHVKADVRHVPTTAPAPKMDAPTLRKGACSCGWTSSGGPSSEQQALKTAREHANAMNANARLGESFE